LQKRVVAGRHRVGSAVDPLPNLAPAVDVLRHLVLLSFA